MRVRFLAVGILLAAALPAASTAAKPAYIELTGAMNGKAETPMGSPTGGAQVTVKLYTTSRVCWRFVGVKGIDTPTAAHIHRGRPGVAGPIVIPFGPVYKATGCTNAAPTLMRKIRSSPAAYYVNVHTKKYPAGAIRAQLTKAIP